MAKKSDKFSDPKIAKMVAKSLETIAEVTASVYQEMMIRNDCFLFRAALLKQNRAEFEGVRKYFSEHNAKAKAEVAAKRAEKHAEQVKKLEARKLRYMEKIATLEARQKKFGGK